MRKVVCKLYGNVVATFERFWQVLQRTPIHYPSSLHITLFISKSDQPFINVENVWPCNVKSFSFEGYLAFFAGWWAGKP